ncbi:MAG: hypothetical protein ACJ74G_18615 [Blastocatellia bacterium]
MTDRPHELIDAQKYCIVTAKKSGRQPVAYVVFTDDSDHARQLARRFFDSQPEMNGANIEVTAGRIFMSNTYAELLLEQGRTLPMT